MKQTTILAALVAAVSTAPAGAQERPPAAVADVARCRTIGEAAARLACFDAAAARLEAAVNEKQITVLDREGVRRTRRSLFGFSLPSIGLFGGGKEDRDEVKEVDGVVRQVQSLPNGRYELVLEDGARWQTTEPTRWAPEAGAKVHIERASLGSYWIAVERARTVRGRRVG